MTVEINKAFVSLPVRCPVQLTANKPVTWSSNNANVLVSATGEIIAPIDKLRPDGQAVITATDIA